jgi:hypothetical protein
MSLRSGTRTQDIRDQEFTCRRILLVSGPWPLRNGVLRDAERANEGMVRFYPAAELEPLSWRSAPIVLSYTCRRAAQEPFGKRGVLRDAERQREWRSGIVLSYTCRRAAQEPFGAERPNEVLWFRPLCVGTFLGAPRPLAAERHKSRSAQSAQTR